MIRPWFRQAAVPWKTIATQTRTSGENRVSTKPGVLHMDATVTLIGEVVVAELRAAGYMESTIGQYAKTIRALARYAEERGGVYSPGLGAEFASMRVSPRTGRFSAQRRLAYGRLVGVFDSYVRTGRVDLSVRGRDGGGPRPGENGLAVLDAAWEADMAGRGLAPATRAAYRRVARGYLG